MKEGLAFAMKESIMYPTSWKAKQTHFTDYRGQYYCNKEYAK